MKFAWIAALAVAASFVLGHSAHAQGMSSTNYRIPSSVINSGGGTASSANYQLIASIGEPIIGLIGTPPPAGSDNYQVNAGFLATLLAVVGTPGDINMDGVVDMNDVKLALQIAAGLQNSAAPTVSFGNGDVNAATPDGKINILDADKILRRVTGLQPTLP